ncbi:MAG: hypothetical protein OHK0029_05150 [Armatimonadaceae bacterium]
MLEVQSPELLLVVRVFGFISAAIVAALWIRWLIQLMRNR